MLIPAALVAILSLYFERLFIKNKPAKRTTIGDVKTNKYGILNKKYWTIIPNSLEYLSIRGKLSNTSTTIKIIENENSIIR
jgi:hypothetical protein